ncbi:RCC1 domain-containing protein [Pandoraea sp. NPDC087047]|uniref:RCC1 domain-containing protein n=1 Tax=Pandoraea sp. NPDC087047 TaxID=3364390 RepID=UPI003809185A
MSDQNPVVGAGSAAASPLAAPQCPVASGGVLDPDFVGTADVEFVVPVYDGMEKNDAVMLRFDVGQPGEHTEMFPVSEFWKNQPLPIGVPKNIVSAALGRTVEVDYVVYPAGGGAMQQSAVLSLVIGHAPGLAAPSVDEAVDGHLSAELAQFDVHVRIPVYSGMQVGDVVYLFWEVPGRTGAYTDQMRLQHVRDVTFLVPASVVSSGIDEVASVRYEVERAGNRTRSDVLRLRIGDADDPERLARPVLNDAIGDQLNPALVDRDRGASVLIPPYAGIREGDRVTVEWAGGPPAGMRWQYDVSRKFLTQPYPLRIPYDKIQAFVDKTVTLQYTVEGDGGTTVASNPLLLHVGSAVLTFAPPTLDKAPDGMLDPRDVDLADGVEVSIAPYPGMRQADVVLLRWTQLGTPGTSTAKAQAGTTNSWTSEYVVSGADLGKVLSLSVPWDVVSPGFGGRAEVTYEVMRAGASIGKSGVRTVQLVYASLPAPVVPEAQNGEVEPGSLPDGVHVLIGASARLRNGDVVVLSCRGAKGAGSTKIEHLVTPGEAGGDLSILLPSTLLDANVGRQVEIRYAVRFADNHGTAQSPAITLTVLNVPGTGTVSVRGSRASDNNFRGFSFARHLYANDAATGKALRVQWRYADETKQVVANTFVDTRPWVELVVSSLSDSLTLRPGNIAGTAVTTGTVGAFAALLDDHKVAAWGAAATGGAVPPTLMTYDDVVEISASGNAFALRRSNGRIAVWGGADGGGVLPAGFVVTDAVRIVASNTAFAVLRANGKVVAWGAEAAGGTVPPAIAALTDIRAICATVGAFAAIRRNGQVVAWGASTNDGASVPPEIADLTDIVDVRATSRAFCALRANGSVVAWGVEANGATVPDTVAARSDIAEISAASAAAFTVRTTGSQVLSWGDAAYGGTFDEVVAMFDDIDDVCATLRAFAARRRNGSVIGWGDAAGGGTVSDLVAARNDTVSLASTSGAFAALSRGGQVLAWGDPLLGGTIDDDTAALLTDVTAIYGNAQAFAAITQAGNVVTWGNATAGGNSATALPILSGRIHQRWHA